MLIIKINIYNYNIILNSNLILKLVCLLKNFGKSAIFIWNTQTLQLFKGYKRKDAINVI